MKKFTILMFLSLSGCGVEVTHVASCAIDNIGNATKLNDKEFSVSSNTIFTLQGWAANVEGDQAPKKITVQLVDKTLKVIELGSTEPNFDRPDLATVFGKQNIHMSGYNIITEPQEIPIGVYNVEIVQDFDNVKAVCPANTKLTIQK